MTRSILIVDDDPIQRRLLEAQVMRLGLRPVSVGSGREAIARLAEGGPAAPDLMLLDLVMPDEDGLAVLEAVRRSGRDISVIVQTACDSASAAVEAMRAGAIDYLVKPVTPESLGATLTQALKVRDGGRLGAGAGPLDPQRYSPAFSGVVSIAAKAAPSTIPILLRGETGTGKEWVARAVHQAGPRRSGPFVAVNCGAVPADLVESLLFGHERGAFTGAGQAHEGKFAEAHGGTLFLDEVAELPGPMQVKLLRALQEGEIDPVGGKAPRRVDVRIISATNRDLEAARADRSFREDLYFRLNAIELTIPPLRERRSEISDLAHGFLKAYAAREKGRTDMSFSPEALRLLEAHDFPGNIRELENHVRRAVVLADRLVLRPDDFAPVAAMVGAAGPAPLRGASEAAKSDPEVAHRDEKGEFRALDAIEADIIRAALAHYRGRISEVARRLGIGRSTLYRKMKAHDIPH